MQHRRSFTSRVHWCVILAGLSLLVPVSSVASASEPARTLINLPTPVAVASVRAALAASGAHAYAAYSGNPFGGAMSSSPSGDPLALLEQAAQVKGIQGPVKVFALVVGTIDKAAFLTSLPGASFAPWDPETAVAIGRASTTAPLRAWSYSRGSGTLTQNSAMSSSTVSPDWAPSYVSLNARVALTYPPSEGGGDLRQITHSFAWSSASGLDVYRTEDAAYEHDLKEFLPPSSINGSRPLCSGQNDSALFWASRDNFAFVSDGIPEEAGFYVDTDITDPCNTQDLTFGIIQPENLAPNATYSVDMFSRMPDGAPPSSTFALASQLVHYDCNKIPLVPPDRRRTSPYCYGLIAGNTWGSEVVQQSAGFRLPTCLSWSSGTDPYVNCLSRVAVEAPLLVSSNSGNQPANEDASAPSSSDNGRYVAFESKATNLVAGVTIPANTMQVYLKDTATGVITLASKASLTQAGDSWSYGADISGDGRYVMFMSWADDLVAGDTNGAKDVFVYDRLAPAPGVRRVSVGVSGQELNSYSDYAAISRDGSTVAFDTFATNSGVGDANGDYDVFAYSLATGVSELVSQSSSSVIGDAGSFTPSVSGDGRFVAFRTKASNFGPGTATYPQVYVRDRSNGTTTIVSADQYGNPANIGAVQPQVSDSGRYIAFDTISNNLVSGDTNGVYDSYLVDRDLDADGIYDEMTPAARKVSILPGFPLSSMSNDMSELTWWTGWLWLASQQRTYRVDTRANGTSSNEGNGFLSGDGRLVMVVTTDHELTGVATNPVPAQIVKRHVLGT